MRLKINITWVVGKDCVTILLNFLLPFDILGQEGEFGRELHLMLLLQVITNRHNSIVVCVTILAFKNENDIKLAIVIVAIVIAVADVDVVSVTKDTGEFMNFSAVHIYQIGANELACWR